MNALPITWDAIFKMALDKRGRPVTGPLPLSPRPAVSAQTKEDL